MEEIPEDYFFFGVVDEEDIVRVEEDIFRQFFRIRREDFCVELIKRDGPLLDIIRDRDEEIHIIFVCSSEKRSEIFLIFEIEIMERIDE